MRQLLSIQSNELYPADEHPQDAAKPVQISSMGGLVICVHGRDIGVQAWKSPKVYQLLSLIIGMGGKNIAAHQLCDAIWPDVEGDKGMQNLEFILRRLRQVLQPDLGKDLRAVQVILFHQGKVSLNADHCELDIWQWQHTCAQARMLRAQGSHGDASRLEQQAAALISGQFLAGDDGLESITGHRLGWHSHCCGWLDATISLWRNDGCCAYHQMIMLFDIWLQLDPSSERLCMQRMRVLLEEGYSVDARRVYFDWVQLIRDQYGLNPSAQAIALANKFNSGLKA